MCGPFKALPCKRMFWICLSMITCEVQCLCLLAFRYFFSSLLTGDYPNPFHLMLMFPYWFMTAFSIIRMDWQVDSVCPDLPIQLMVFDTWSTLMDVWSIVSIFPIWCPPLLGRCHCPSAWDQPRLQYLLSVSQFPRLTMEDNESTFNTERRDTAGSLWDTPNGSAFWYSHVTQFQPGSTRVIME